MTALQVSRFDRTLSSERKNLVPFERSRRANLSTVAKREDFEHLSIVYLEDSIMDLREICESLALMTENYWTSSQVTLVSSSLDFKKSLENLSR